VAKILIVDDDRYIVEVAKVALEIEGHEVISAFDGEEAIAKVMHEFPNLIILDLLMPKMDGWEAYKQLKEYSKTTHIPIIIISALEERKGMTEDMEVEDYIEKPFEINDLVNRIKRVLARTMRG
jgi:two-component system response regulator VicR